MNAKLLSIIMSALVMLGGAQLLNACGSGTSRADSTNTTSAPDGTYTERNAGTTIAVLDDVRFTLQLKENPTTGFVWKVVLPETLRIVDDRYEPSDTSKTPAAGAGGTRVLTFASTRIAKPGVSAGHLVLNLERSWESTGPAETLDFPLVGPTATK
jgi:predicted secreted protein